ncbi:MAG TPA: hypothetical protein VF401_02840 [Candidatus Saccharimonadales bacterium]
MQEIIGTSKNNVSVTYDPIYSHAATHLEDTPQLKSLASEVIAGMELVGQEVKTDVDLGRVVGVCDVVAVDDTDEIVYGVRKNREDDGLVPFTKSRRGTPCNRVAVHLIPQPDKTYELSSAWIGEFGEDDEPFPQSPSATERSIDFWKRWAFVYGSQEILPGTETSEYPW